MPNSPLSKPPKRRWRRWLLRLFLAGVAALVLAAVFHEALLRAVLRHGGPMGAEMAGVKLTWEVEGSVMRDLKLTNIAASGLMIEKATVGEFSAVYDAHAALTDVVKRIALKQVDAVVDLRKVPKSETVPEKPVETSKEPPPLVWPEVIDIENVNASVTLADGKVVTIRGLTLRIGEGMPGVFECAEFKLEPGDLRVAGVKAEVEWKKHHVSIRFVDLPYDTKLSSLDLDIRGYQNGDVKLTAHAFRKTARLDVYSEVKDIWGESAEINGLVQLVDVVGEELSGLPFNLPEGVNFERAGVHLRAEGKLKQFNELKVNGGLGVTDVRAAGVMLDRVSAVFAVKDGVAHVSEARVLRGVNEVVASVEAKLAEEVMKSPWKAALKAKMADVTQFLVKPPPVMGVVEISASAEGVGATPVKAEAQVDGSELGFERYQLPKLAVDVAMDGKEAKVNVPALMLGDGNQIDLKASMRMEDDMPVTAEWKMAVDDPALLMKTLNLPPLEQSVTAKLSTTGKATLRVNDPMNVEAEMMLSVKDGRLGEAPLPVVEMKAAVAKGEAVVESCRVLVDERNHVELKGTAGLREPWRFGLDGVVEMPELKALNTLLAAFKAPVIESGALMAKLDVSGDAKPWRGEGNVTLEAKAVKVAGMPEAADVALKMAFEGTTATMESLQAVVGPWKLITKGVVNETSADLSELSLHQKDRQLLSGHAKAAFDLSALDVVLNAKDLPVHEVAAAAGVKDMPPAILNTEIAVRGLEDAEVKVNLKDVKAPGLPKGFSPAAVDVLTVLRGGKLVVEAKVDQKPLQPLLMKAEAPVVIRDLMAKPALAADLPIKATLDLAESDLSFVRDFAPELLRSVPAKMRLNAKVGGTVKAPLVDSALDVDVPEVVFASADLPSVREVKVRVRTHDRTVRLEEVSALLAGGHVKLGGAVDVAKTDDPRFDLKLEAREALVFRNPTSSLRANADIACSGGLKAAKVSGVVEAVRGRIFQEVNLLPNVMGVIKQGEKLPPPPASTSKSVQKVELPPMLKDWSFDVKVRTRDPVLLAGNLVNGAISADVKLGGTGAKPLLTGFANVDRLIIKLPFSLLKITKGVVTMNPENPFAPKLDVRGESRVGSTDISLYVYGEATNPKTRFTSSPPMSEADIVTMLGTGMTLGGDNAQMASEAMARAAFLVVSETWRKLFNSEKKVSDEPPKLHMTFNPSGGDRANDSMQAMYELTPKVRFTGRFMQSGRMKALLGYVLRFGKAARAVEEQQ